MTLTEQLLHKYIVESKARIVVSNEEIEKLRKVILEDYAMIKEAQTALQDMCLHDEYTTIFVDEYTSGSYYDKSSNIRTFSCTNCGKVLNIENTSGGYD